MTSTGRNLLIGTANFTATGNSWSVAGPTSAGASWNIPSTWTKEEDGDGTYSLTKYNGAAWGGFGPRVDLSEGDIVTVSFDLKKSANARVLSVHTNVRIGNVKTGLRVIAASDNCKGWTANDCWISYADEEIAEWTRFWLTIEATQDVTLQTRIESYTSCDYISIRRMKWEFGTTATPWRPAPEDLATPSDVVYASDSADVGDVSGMATTGQVSAAQAAANGYADAQVATRARTFATGWEYRLTSDTAVDPAKTYYARTGSGTEQDPYDWEPVENPSTAQIATYWELLPEHPAPPYSVGDMWLQGDGGAILVCVGAKAAGGAYEDGDWADASGYTDDAAALALEDGVDALRQADAAMATRIDSVSESARTAISALDGRVAAAEGSISGVSGRLVSLEDYVRVVGGDHLELGKAGSSVTASLENDRLAFLLVGQDAPVAYIAADEDGTGKLFVTQAVVVSELQFGHGNWAWTERKNGNMALKWRGGEA